MLAAADYSGPELKEPFETASVPALRWWLHCRKISCAVSLCKVCMIACITSGSCERCGVGSINVVPGLQPLAVITDK